MASSRSSAVVSAAVLRAPAVASAVISRNHCVTGLAGVPPQRAPGGTSPWTLLAAAICAPSPIVTWLLTPTLPPSTTKSSSVDAAGNSGLRHDDAMAADADIVADLDQIVDLGALADHGVADGAAVDRGAGADLDVVLDDDAADLRHLAGGRSAPITKPKPSWPIRQPGWMMTRSPISASRDRRRRRRSSNRARCARRRRSRRSAPITVPVPISARGPMTAPGSTVTPLSSRAVGCTCAPATLPASQQRGRPQRVRETARARPSTKAR